MTGVQTCALPISLRSAKTALSIWTDQTRHDVQTWAEHRSIRSLIVSLATRSNRETMTTEASLSSPELYQLRSILGPVTQAKQQIGFVVFDRTGLQIAALLDEPVGKQTLVLRSFFVSRALDRKSTRLNSSHTDISRMPSSA